MVGSQTAEQGGDFRLTRPIREKGDGENRNCNQLRFENQKTEFWLLKISVATKIVQIKHVGCCTFQLKHSLNCDSLLPECGGEKENLFSNLEAVMARKEPGLSRSLTFEPGEQMLLIIQLSIILLINLKQLFPCSNFEHLQWVTMPARSDQSWWGERQVSAIYKNSSELAFDFHRFVAVFCFSTKAGVKNSAKVNNCCRGDLEKSLFAGVW